MVMQRLSTEEEQQPQQPIPIFGICWDDLFKFLRDLFKPKTARPYANLNRLTTTNKEYHKVVEWVVPEGFRGELEQISFTCPNSVDFGDVMWKLEVAGIVKFEDKYIGTSLSLPFGGCSIHTLQKVTIWGKSVSGASVTLDGAISGKEIKLV